MTGPLTIEAVNASSGWQVNISSFAMQDWDHRVCLNGRINPISGVANQSALLTVVHEIFVPQFTTAHVAACQVSCGGAKSNRLSSIRSMEALMSIDFDLVCA